MAIKPLEVKQNLSIFLKLFFLVSLIATGVLLDRVFLKKIEVPEILGKTKEKKTSGDFISQSVEKAQELGEEVLGEATDLLESTTANISSSVSDVIYENSFGKIVDQIDKLPQDQQERIREQICK